MHLIIDIGNSSAKVATFEGDNLAEHIRVEHAELPTWLRTNAMDGGIEQAIVSSVVPLSDELEQAIESLPYPCLRMSAQLKMPFSIAYQTPETLGPDRWPPWPKPVRRSPGATCWSSIWAPPSPTTS